MGEEIVLKKGMGDGCFLGAISYTSQCLRATGQHLAGRAEFSCRPLCLRIASGTFKV